MYLRETSTKPLGMLTHLLTALFCQLVSSALFCWLSPPGLFYQLASLGLSFPRPLPVSSKILHPSSFGGFRARTNEGILWLAPTNTKTTNSQHSVTAQLPVDHFVHPVLSIFVKIWLVLMALFCAAIQGDSISLSQFPFHFHVHVFSHEMLLISGLKMSIKLVFFPF